MQRDVQPELLDSLPPAAPQALASRADLRRLNRLMGHAGILAQALRRRHAAPGHSPRPLRLVELGAGDGTLLLRLAHPLAAAGVNADVTLVDTQDLVSAQTRAAFARLDWSVNCVAADVFCWLDQAAPAVDVMLANLFLHHFTDIQLVRLLRLAAARTNLFLACEPRRSPLALTASSLLGFIGCNDITRHDARVSVRAGFAGHDLSALWPADGAWELGEHPAGCFSHCFSAQRHV